MRFSTRNSYYLRISSHTVIPLYLYLDEQHVDWMSDRVLQHVLADLRPRIPVKLTSETDAHFGPGGSANAKKGSLDVHRGDTYQFGYFLRKTDPHAVLIKTRRFVAAPPAPRSSSSKLSEAPLPSTRDKRKRGAGNFKKVAAPPKVNKKRKTKGKGRARSLDRDDEDVIVITSEEDDDSDGAVDLIPPPKRGPPRRSARAKGKRVAGGYREASDEDRTILTPAQVSPNVIDVDSDVEMSAPASEQPGKSQDVEENAEMVDHPPPFNLPSLDDTGLIAMDEDENANLPTRATPLPIVKSEEVEHQLPTPTIRVTPPTTDTDDPKNDGEPSTSIHTESHIADSDIQLVPDDEEEEPKPKPLLKLSYQGFNIHGRCLCVIVEPYPPIRSSSRAVSLAPTGLLAPRTPSIAPPDFVLSGGAGQRERTPLFLPEYDRQRSITPAPGASYLQQQGPQKSLPRVPLFDEEVDEDDEDELGGGGGMYELSQILQSVGGYPGGAMEDDDEIDGAVFFGDADEAREL